MNLFIPMLVVGLITSVHCVSMCGPLVLTYAVKGGHDGSLPARMLPHLVYHAAKLVSYTVIGVIAGAVGAAFKIGGTGGWVMVVAGVFMLLLGLNMTGWVPALRNLTPRPPKFLTDLLRRTRKQASADEASGHLHLATPATFGLLTGLLPCGPLYAAIAAAAGAGSWLYGGIAMFAFGLGTVPLLLGFGAVSGYLSGKMRERMMVVLAVVVMVVGLVMLDRGAMLVGSPVTFSSMRAAVMGQPAAPAADAAFKTAADGVVEVPVVIENTKFIPSTVTVPAGRAVRLIVDRREAVACSDQIAVPSLGVLVNLAPNGVTPVTLPASKAGDFTLTCGMGMMSGRLVVTGGAGSGATEPIVWFAMGAIALLVVGGGGYLVLRGRGAGGSSKAAAKPAPASKTTATKQPKSGSKGGSKAPAPKATRKTVLLGFTAPELALAGAVVVAAVILGVLLAGRSATTGDSAIPSPSNGSASALSPATTPASATAPAAPSVPKTDAAASSGSGAASTGSGSGTGGGAGSSAAAQTVRVLANVAQGRWEPATINLKAGVPAEITFGPGTGCMAAVQSSDLGFYEDISAGPKTVKLPALQPGTYSFSCGMQMVFGKIVVR